MRRKSGAKMAGKCHICISPYSSVFHNFQHVWSDFLAEVSTIRKSSTNNVCIPDYSLIYSAGSRPLEKRGVGGGARSAKKNFSSLRASLWSKNKGVGEPGSPGSVTDLN